MPTYYKFSGLYQPRRDAPQRPRALQTLEEMRVKVSPPNQFNDPFELTPTAINPLAGSDDLIRRAQTNPSEFEEIRQMMAKDGKHVTLQQFARDLPVQMHRYRRQTRNQMRKQLWQRDSNLLNWVSDQMAILCLVRNLGSICMWSHYGADHRGAAIGFDFSIKPPAAFDDEGDVRYRAKRGRIDWNNPARRDTRHLIFRKSKEWAYEREYRYTMHLQNVEKSGTLYFLRFDPEHVREVVFGCLMDEAHKTAIYELLNYRHQSFRHVKVFECEKDKTQYRLRVVPVTRPPRVRVIV